jgi:hypothetical protein
MFCENLKLANAPDCDVISNALDCRLEPCVLCEPPDNDANIDGRLRGGA